MGDIIDVSIGGNSAAIEAAFGRVTGLGRSLGLTLEGIGAPLANVLGVALGGATVASLINLGLQATQLGEKIFDLSQQTGLTIDQFEALAYAADQNGSSADQAARAIVKLRDALAQAQNGSKDAQQDFAALGLNWRALVDTPIGDAVQRVATAMFAAGEDTSTFGAALDLLGVKNAPALQAALKELAVEGFDGLAKKGRDAGLVMGDDTVRRLEEAKQAIDDLQRALIIFTTTPVIGLKRLIFGPDELEQSVTSFMAIGESMERMNAAMAQFKTSGGLFPIDEVTAYRDALVETNLTLQEGNIKALEDALAAQRKYYEDAGMLDDYHLSLITRQQEIITALRKKTGLDSTTAAEESAAAQVAAEQTVTEAAEQRGRIVGEMLRNLADERVKPLIELQRQLGMTMDTAFTAKPLDLYNQTMEHLNRLLAEGKITQEQFASAANLAADALAKVTTQRTPAEALDETLRRLKVEMDNGQMSAEAYAQAVANAQAKFTTQRTAGEALAETYRKLRQEFDNGQMSQEAYTRAMQEAADKAQTVKTPLEAYNARVRELNNLLADGLISQDAYARAMEDAQSSLRSIKDPIEIYNERLRDLKRLSDDGAISQEALARAIRDADEAAGSAALNELNRQIGITEAGGNESEAARARDYITRAREAAARGTPEGEREAQWLIGQANGITGGGATLEEVLGRGSGGGSTTTPTGDLRDSEGRDPWDLGYTGAAGGPQDQSGAGDAGGGMQLSADAAAIVAKLDKIADKVGVFS